MPASLDMTIRDRFGDITKEQHRNECVPRPTPRLHPFVSVIFSAMSHQRISYQDVARRSGVSAYTLRNWHRGQLPELANLIAVYEVLSVKAKVWWKASRGDA
jgi:lambda repressor-like predicted transcriptional regulator